MSEQNPHAPSGEVVTSESTLVYAEVDENGQPKASEAKAEGGKKSKEAKAEAKTG